MWLPCQRNTPAYQVNRRYAKLLQLSFLYLSPRPPSGFSLPFPIRKSSAQPELQQGRLLLPDGETQTLVSEGSAPLVFLPFVWFCYSRFSPTLPFGPGSSKRYPRNPLRNLPGL